MTRSKQRPTESDTERLLQQLLATPVGRRWLLKAGLGLAAAVAAAHLPVSLRSASAAPVATDAAQSASTASGKQADRKTAKRTLHVALGHTLAAGGGISDLQMVANGARQPLVAHTAQSRAALQKQGGIFAKADLSALTHYVQDLPLPADRGMLVSVHGVRAGKHVVLVQMFSAPEATTLAMARAAASSGNGVHTLVGPQERLATLGLSLAQVTAPEEVTQLDSILDVHQTSLAYTMCHPNVATIVDSSVTATKSLLGQTPAVTNLGTYIDQMQADGKDWATLTTVNDRDGSASKLAFKDPTTGTTTTTTFSTMRVNPDGDDNFRSAAQSALRAGVAGVRDSSALGQVVDKPISQYPTGTSFETWTQPQGVTPQPSTYTPPSTALAAVGGGIDINIRNTGMQSGTQTTTNGSFANGQVPLSIYNNYVRCMWAYVQYLGKDGTNLSANPNPSWPDTQYSKALSVVSPVSTMLGVPLWGSNSANVTLTFPPDALSARLLYCGLGADVYGAGWRQYFPDNAYPDCVAPTSEVMFSALWTGIVVIGLDVFSLVTDFPVGAAWASVRKMLEVPADQAFAAVQAVTQNPSLTGAEAAAAQMASGGATYTNLQNNGGDVTNQWTTLLALGTVVPKVLFSPVTDPYWAEVALVILAEQAADKLAESIPFIGEVVSAIELLADVASLAEVAAETIVSPWVIENEVTLTYQATVAVSHDPAASGWPATASSWELTPRLDGAVMPNSTTGDINVGGRVGSDPLSLTVTAPYGSDTIQWGIVIQDPDGHQVGTGVSPTYTNDDPSNPPTQVSFAITEIPAPIGADTVFNRADTLTYSDTAGGFTWSNDSSVTEVAGAATPSSNTAIQQVTGATVATSLGVVGVVWQANDQYFLQGVPIVENSGTVELVPASKGGYVRPPFLLFDAFVDRADPTSSKHVLLEPDNTSDAYLVRSVNLDPESGAVTWDSSAALGTFTLPVSAAALHSSGCIVTVHTDTGRLGILQPAATARPGLAAYRAGQGAQTGLLQSPTAVAITNPGVALILDAGASQLAAFDLNGNPVPYFGTDPNNLQYTQPLATPGMYLDIAVDGASHIYLLYVTGDGSQPADYHVDVYNPNGEPLATNSPGVNIGRLAVDYWRSIYGINFISLMAPGATGAVPSISRFDPS
jgi:hypothetical protein